MEVSGRGQIKVLPKHLRGGLSKSAKILRIAGPRAEIWTRVLEYEA
jgi:hypothetical protein